MAMTASRWAAQRQKLFMSVFDTEVSQPTPYSTPSLRSTDSGQPFGGPSAAAAQPHSNLHSLDSTNTPAAAAPPPPPPSSSPPSSSFTQITDQACWDRAWHAVTSRVQLPPSVAAEDSFGSLASESQDLTNPDFYASLQVVLQPSQHAPHAAHTEDLFSWHTHQVRHHFVQHVLPLLAACAGHGDATQVLLGSIRTLEAAHRQYLYGLALMARGLDEPAAERAVDAFRRDLHALISNSMAPALVDALRRVLSRLMRVLLRMQPESLTSSASPAASQHAGRRRGGGSSASASDQTDGARRELRQLVEALHKVGLAGEKFQVLFAEMMDALMVEHIKTSFAGAWTQQTQTAASAAPLPPPRPPRASLRRAGSLSPCIASLHDWVENHYARLAVEVFDRLGAEVVAWKHVEEWKEIAVGRLAVTRIHELFDIVLHWPESRDALDDLRVAVTTPQRRLQLTDTFSAALQKRLLHPGRSTLDILQVYISMIRTFHALDHSKVLLERVVHNLQLYLCQRDDAIRIVVTGLLSGPDEAAAAAAGGGSGMGRLQELAALLNDPAQQRRQTADDEELDWNDMDWVPDPVDAGVNYKRPKSEDVIGTLINALGSQDIFIKEFQSIIAERLLSKQTKFSQEVKVLNLLKKKFGENALQNCDVMLKDIQDSTRVDTVITRQMQMAEWGQTMLLSYHTKILSRLFWPTLDREHFLLPQPVIEMQSRYDTRYESLKSSRKLTWLNNLGTATVHLDLEDRSIDQECKTYEAAVIYAFQDDGSSTSPVQRTVSQLEDTLQMDDDTIRLALVFWASQRVLREVAPDTYVVLERLEEDTAPAPRDSSPALDDDDVAPPHDTVSPSKTGRGAMDAQEKERRLVYWQFILGMLTNSAPTMPLGQMAMMMKMLIPDGFPWSNEELQEFLAEKMAEGELELVGGKYRLPKK
ncbi:hypothetical protein VDGD_08754 [Verticillium dahliae]|nr:hypothetical protein VDGD_08754 [Verticillium dahliae]